MYEFKKNKETGNYELVKVDFNFHPSVVDRKAFDEVFTREYARYEYFQLDCKIANGLATQDDEEKWSLLSNEYSFTSTDNHTDFQTGLHPVLQSTMFLTLFAHGKLLNGVKTNDDDTKQIQALRFTLGLDEFYSKCKTLIPQIETGATDLETVIDTVKPLYRDAVTFINHDAEKGVSKKWVESEKEKNVRAFVTGLLSTYKLTRSNRIKKDSPLKSRDTFERYVAMWLVTNGVIVDNAKKSGKAYTTANSILMKIDRDSQTK